MIKRVYTGKYLVTHEGIEITSDQKLNGDILIDLLDNALTKDIPWDKEAKYTITIEAE